MKLTPPLTVKEVADLIQCEFVGDGAMPVTGLNEIHSVEQGDLVFVDHPKYYDKALNSAATTILINKEVECPEGKALIISGQPFFDYNALTQKFKPFSPWQGEPQLGNNTVIHKSATIGRNVTIGDNCIIYPGVVLGNDTTIGNDVIIHANTVLGGDAFYYKTTAEGHNKMHSCGRVVIEDKVEIGANCTIDRGVSGDTRIGEGTKIDNLVQIGHDTIVGKHCRLAAHVGVAGCVKIGDWVTLWGQVGVISGITIEDRAEVYGQSGVGRSLEGNKSYLGSPAVEAREKWKEMAVIKKLTNKGNGA